MVSLQQHSPFLRLVRLEPGSLIGIWAPGAGIEFPLAEALQGTGVIGMVGHHPTQSITFNSLFPTPKNGMREKQSEEVKKSF